MTRSIYETTVICKQKNAAPKAGPVNNLHIIAILCRALADLRCLSSFAVANRRIPMLLQCSGAVVLTVYIGCKSLWRPAVPIAALII
jgi:hypothetical protein